MMTSYIAFKALRVCGDQVYSPYYHTKWNEVYVSFLSRLTYSLSAPSLDKKQGVYAATFWEAWRYMDENCRMFLITPDPDAETEVGTKGWRSTCAIVIGEVTSLHDAARLIIASHQAGYPQISEILKWARSVLLLRESLADRIPFDEAVRAWAYECLRNAGVPVWEIDPDELARHIDLEGLPKTDDLEEAKARCIDVFRSAHAEMLRDEIDEAIDELPHDVGDIEAHVRPCRLLWMPDEKSLDALGDAAGHYGDNGGDPDGDLWLAPAKHFSPDELATAITAGGKVIDGYEFDYPRGVDIDRSMSYIIVPGAVALRGWCGYQIDDVGYALDRNVATAVCAASIAPAKEEEEEEENQD